MLYSNRANFRERPAAYSATGDGTEPVWEYDYDETTGTKKLVMVGRESVYDKVQESLEETKITNIIKRATFDPEALGTMDWAQRETLTDISSLPSNIHEYHDLMVTAENDFKRLPSEIRELFNNDVSQFVAELGTPEWETKINSLNKPKTEVKEETKQDEQKQ